MPLRKYIKCDNQTFVTLNPEGKHLIINSVRINAVAFFFIKDFSEMTQTL